MFSSQQILQKKGKEKEAGKAATNIKIARSEKGENS